MYRLFLVVALASTLFFSNISADTCPQCDSYIAALKKCQTNGASISTIGSTIDSTVTHCMCVAESSYSQMSSCQVCDDSALNTDAAIELLGSWTVTCLADDEFDDQQAALCWAAQPLTVPPECIVDTSKLNNTDGAAASSTTGTASATGNGNIASSAATNTANATGIANIASAVATETAKGGTDTAATGSTVAGTSTSGAVSTTTSTTGRPSTTSSQTANTTPSATAKSDAMRSLGISDLQALIVVGLMMMVAF